MDDFQIVKDLSAFGNDFKPAELNESELKSNPIEQFLDWIEFAIANEDSDANAMVLSTASQTGRTSSRIVLLKYLCTKGLVFFTNYESKKGKHLKENQQASALFYWHKHQRQVRIEGRVEKISSVLSDSYFSARLPDSQIGAIVSQQSQVIPSISYLFEKVDELKQSIKGKKLIRPYYWGGYILVPDLFEFLQGQPNRLSDRLQYRMEKGNWIIERLAP